MHKALIISASLLYLGILFLVAWAIDSHVRKGRTLRGRSWMYTLSLAVYCTAWTYYGSVGRAATNGLEFITIYLGPLVTCALAVPVLQKMLRVSKSQRINSVADFISTRYGKNFSLGVIVTLGCVIGIIPYIALQLKAISNSFHVITASAEGSRLAFWQSDSFYIAVLLALFVIVFGTRSVDISERHQGLVGAIAFESVVKLVAFLSGGIFITYGLFNGFTDLFQRSHEAGLSQLFTLNEHQTDYSNWLSMLLISMVAIVLLPRQFQVAVVENTDERHLYRAIWMLPLYLLVINVFVLPIAMGGLLTFGSSEGADTFILSLPMSRGQNVLSLFVYLGGFSAATGMIIVETIALATMVSNHLVLPLFIAQKRLAESSLTGTVLLSRRGSIVVILLLAYLYGSFIAPGFSLVSIGLVSMAAMAQFAPVMIGALYWKGASRKGAVTGIAVGFAVWFYTLIVPSSIQAGYIDAGIMERGPWGISLLKPQALFGIHDFSLLAHSVFWSLLLNSICYITVSLWSKLNPQEVYQAALFTGIFQHDDQLPEPKATAAMKDVLAMMAAFIGDGRSQKLISSYAQRHKIKTDQLQADSRIVAFAERALSGVIGSASARFMMGRITNVEEIALDEVLNIVRESQQVLELNKELKKKSIELTRATDALTTANEQLQKLDQMKDEFLYTVTHELRTPLTSIRAMSEIVHDNPDMDEALRQQYLQGIVKETERLTHLITQVLNLERYESGRHKLQLSSVDLGTLLAEVTASLQPLAHEKGATLRLTLPNTMFLHQCDREMIYQAVYNLVANALKFVPDSEGSVQVVLREAYQELQIWVEDNGRGIDPELQEQIFDKFFQAPNQTLKKPVGSGLGLAICKRIAELHNGRIWVESTPGTGSRFAIALPAD